MSNPTTPAEQARIEKLASIWDARASMGFLAGNLAIGVPEARIEQLYDIRAAQLAKAASKREEMCQAILGQA